MSEPLVSVIMGSVSDWECMKVCSETLDEFQVVHETRAISAHRTPDLLEEYLASAESRGVQIIIAAAGGAAHLGGVIASKTTLPVLGVPMPTKSLGGLDSLLSIVQMPKGIPVASLAIGSAGAVNAALLAVAVLALTRPGLQKALQDYRGRQQDQVRSSLDPRSGRD